MVEVLTAISESSQQELFLINGGVHPNVTSLFLRADTPFRRKLVGTVGIFRDAAERDEQTGRETFRSGMSQTAEFRAGLEAVKVYPEVAQENEWSFIEFREGLAAHTGDQLRQIETELTAILDGSITLSDAEKQQLSNLSDGGLEAYLWTFGINTKDLRFPLLDVGAGMHVRFARDVLSILPDQRVVSTSMHLANPNSVMRKSIADSDETGYGELVACSGVDMPFDDETFGMVVSRNGDPYYTPRKDLLKSLREKHRVLKVGATALLSPAVCEYGNHDITDTDIEPLRDEMDIALRPIPQSGRQFYNSATRTMLVISK